MKTDEEIIKGLAACGIDRCDDCPFYDEDEWKCNHNLPLLALDLLKKQQAEIERLKCETGKLLPKNCPYAVQMEISSNLETKIRAEAVKEFWERLKAQNTMDEKIISVKSGDDLVKEMTGAK